MRDINTIIAAILLFMLSSSNLCGQISDVDKLNAWQLKRFAKNSVRAGDVQSAIFFYEKYREIKPYNNKINYELANLHNQARNYV